MLISGLLASPHSSQIDFGHHALSLRRKNGLLAGLIPAWEHAPRIDSFELSQCHGLPAMQALVPSACGASKHFQDEAHSHLLRVKHRSGLRVCTANRRRFQYCTESSMSACSQATRTSLYTAEFCLLTGRNKSLIIEAFLMVQVKR